MGVGGAERSGNRFVSRLSDVVAAVKKSRDGAEELSDRKKVSIIIVITKLCPSPRSVVLISETGHRTLQKGTRETRHDNIYVSFGLRTVTV